MIRILNDEEGFKINRDQFLQASQFIEVNRIKPQLVEDIIRTQVQKNRQKYRYPAQINRAKIHKNAIQYGFSSPSEDGSSVVCACCNMNANRLTIPICQNTTSFDELTQKNFLLHSGVAMFFSFIKMLIYYLILRFLISDAFNILTNYSGGCRNESCQEFPWNNFSSQAKLTAQYITKVQGILNLATIVFSIIYFMVYRRYQYQLYDTINKNSQTQDDYTIMVSNIPKLDFPKQNQQSVHNVQFYYRKHLEAYFEKKINEWLDQSKNWQNQTNGTLQYEFNELKHSNNGELRSPQIIKSISLCYNLSKLDSIIEIKQQLINQYLKNPQTINPSDQTNSRFSSIPKKIDFLNDCQIILSKQYASDNSVLFNITHFIGYAFISFQYQHYRDYIIQQAETNSKFLIYNGNSLKVSKAVHPVDVNWSNLKVSSSERKSQTLVSYIKLSAILFVTLVILLLIVWARDKFYKPLKLIRTNSAKDFFHFYLPTFIQIIITLIVCHILQQVSKDRSIDQKHKTKTHYNIALIRKMAFSLLCNICVLYLIIHYITGAPLAGQYGLVIQITLLITTILLFKIFTSLILWSQIKKRILVWWKYHRLQDEDTVNTFQVCLNQQYQHPQFNLANWYCFFIAILFTVSFYSYLVPVLIPISIICFIALYWVIKINLFKRSSLSYDFSFQITRSIRRIYQLSILAFAIGNFFFDYKLQNDVKIINIFGLILGFFYSVFILFVPERIQRRLIGQYEKCQKHLFDDCVSDGKFMQTYWMQNPATSLVKQHDITNKKLITNPLFKITFASPQNVGNPENFREKADQ